MKNLILFVLVALPYLLIAQHSLDPELSGKLSEEDGFYKMKSIVLDHYQEKKTIAKSRNNEKEVKRYNKQLKFWNRFLWMAENYLDSEGKLVARSEVDYDAFVKRKKQGASSNRNQPSPWILEGPTNVTNADGIGRVDRLAFHPTNENIIFAGSPHGGLFKTVNGGASWFSFGGYLSSAGVAGIAIHPTNPDIMYVMSGNADGGGLVGRYGYYLPSIGIFKTVDGGINWTLLKLPVEGSYVNRKILVDPSNPNILLAGTSKGIYRSTNAGSTWLKSVTNLSTINVWDMEFHPTNSNIVYASRTNAFLKSNDNGLTFTNEQTFSGELGRTAIAVSPDAPDKVYFLKGVFDTDLPGFGGVYRSDNQGDNLTLLASSPNLFASFNPTRDIMSNQSTYDMGFAVNPLNANEVLVGGLSCWRSGNGGVSWSQVSNYWNTDPNYMHPDIHDLVFNPISNKLFCANDGGVYKREVLGSYTGLHNGLSIATFYHFEYANDEGDLWGGCQDNGFLERISGGLFEVYVGGDGYEMMTDHPYLVDDGESDDIYFVLNDKIKKDCLEGSCEITPENQDEFFPNLAMSPTYEDNIYAGYQVGVYYSTDAGDDWNLISTSTPANWCISTCQSFSNVIYFAGSIILSNGDVVSGSIYKYDHLTGLTFDLSNNLSTAGYNRNLKITDIDVSRTNHRILYVSVSGLDENSKVFKSVDSGNTWTNLSYDLPNIPMFSIKSDASGGIYVGSSLGIYYKRNNSTHWEIFGNGLPAVPVTEIELDPSVLPQIYVSTFGRGIWKTIIYDNSCDQNLTLSGGINGQWYEEAGIQLISTQIISGNPGTVVKYNSGQRILLDPGFQAKQGSVFRTYATGCGGAHGN